MRFINKRDAYEDLQNDLNMVQDTLNSGYFMIIDLFFWALFITIFSPPAHQSVKMAFIFFISFYLSGFCLFILLRRLLKH